MPDSFEQYTHEDIRERFVFYCTECERFIEAQSRRNHPLRLSFDPVVIAGVVQSAMDDIWRYKVYHQDKPDQLSNGIKRAAYFTKWLLRLRPIYHARIVSESSGDWPLEKKDGTLLINEIFAVQRALNAVATELEVERIKLDPDFYADFLYDLHYRDLSEDALLTVFGMIYEMAEGAPAVMKVFRNSETA